MLNLIKSLIGLILYIPSLIIGLLIASYKVAKEEGILEEVKPMNVTDGLRDGLTIAKDFQAEVKKI